MAAVRQIQAHDGVAGLQHRGVRRLIRLRAGVRLHVGVLGAEQLLGAIARQVLHDVGEFAAAVIALARIAFGVLVREHAAGGFQNRFGGEVLAGDQFQLRSAGARLHAGWPRRSSGSTSERGRDMRSCSVISN